MNLKNLLSGIAVVIDDKIGNADTGENDDSGSDDPITEIVNHFEREWNLPFYRTDRMPPKDTWPNLLQSASFILLDWKMWPNGASQLERAGIEENVRFLEQAKDYFVPVFIFTNESPEDVKNALPKEIYRSESPEKNFVFIQAKGELLSDESLALDAVERWMRGSASVYVLKTWEQVFRVARRDLFGSMYARNPDWPRVFWNAYEKDGVDPSFSLTHLINDSLRGRIYTTAFEAEILAGFDSDISHVPMDDLRALIHETTFQTINSEDQIRCSPGDVVLDPGVHEGILRMKLSRFVADNYRSLRDESIELDAINLFIGANASGKSTILDALRFLHEGVRAREFKTPVFQRGGMIHLAWKGEAASRIQLEVNLEDEDRNYQWLIRLIKEGTYGFYVEEEVYANRPQEPPRQILSTIRGEGWWWSGERGQKVMLKQSETACALTAAAADASFLARGVAEFVGRWGFFDPSPFLLRRDWASVESGRFDPYGRNLGETLHTLHESSPGTFEEIVEATRAVVGLSSEIRTMESEGRFYFMQNEPWLHYAVHQMGVSSGTLRMLALMTALLSEPETNLIGIEEPENYVHPGALRAFVQYLLNARERTQLMATTHSPLLLDYLNEPEAVRVVQHHGESGTIVLPQDDPDGVRRALEASGFGLGQFYETKGFGAD